MNKQVAMLVEMDAMNTFSLEQHLIPGSGEDLPSFKTQSCSILKRFPLYQFCIHLKYVCGEPAL